MVTVAPEIQAPVGSAHCSEDGCCVGLGRNRCATSSPKYHESDEKSTIETYNYGFSFQNLRLPLL
jgi:hypothetical protein